MMSLSGTTQLSGRGLVDALGGPAGLGVAADDGVDDAATPYRKAIMSPTR
jgi:hypothetical protein